LCGAVRHGFAGWRAFITDEVHSAKPREAMFKQDPDVTQICQFSRYLSFQGGGMETVGWIVTDAFLHPSKDQFGGVELWAVRR